MHKKGISILELIKGYVKEIIEQMMLEERQIYLDNHPLTKGNGYYSRSLKTAFGELGDIQVPRSRDNGFKSTILPERHRYSVDLEELIRALILAGVSSRKLGEVLKQLYGNSLSHASIARISDVAEAQIQAWRTRRLQASYGVIMFDATYFPLKRNSVEQEAIYVALGIRYDGSREILGYWLPGGSEGAGNWREILEELKERGVEQVSFFVTDGLKGLKEAIREVFPQSGYQRCVLHMVRWSLNKVRVKDRSAVAEDLKRIYRAADIKSARQALELFTQTWRSIYPVIVKSWKEALADLTAFLELPPPIRSYVYTTNALERLMKEMKRRLKTMEMLPSPSSADKFLYLILKEKNEKYLNRKLKNWEFYFQVYLENKNKKSVYRNFQTQLT